MDFKRPSRAPILSNLCHFNLFCIRFLLNKEELNIALLFRNRCAPMAVFHLLMSEKWKLSFLIWDFHSVCMK